MTFSDYKYQRPDTEKLQKEFATSLEVFKAAQDLSQCESALEQIYELRNSYETMREITSIRHTINTLDTFYEGEHNFFDLQNPVYEGLVSDFYHALLNSTHRGELEKKYGKQLFKIAELSIKTFDPAIIDDLRKENELSSAYTKLKASAAIDFEGEERTLTGMMAFTRSKDRNMRKRATAAYWKFMADHKEELERIYHELVQVRNEIATKLGYKNYVQLGYDRMLRTDYDAKMVANFRRQVLEDIVPIAKELKEKQRERLGLDKLKFYDGELTFRNGNPKPKGDLNWIVDKGREMYEELSPETADFYHFMQERNLMDLKTQKGKAGGGYCTYINNFKSPFIFSNFNGTAMDIFVLTHEAGHAFQVYESRGYSLSEYNWPTYEACEIHSMSMEFFTWPWMDRFFEEEADKFKFMHLVKALLFLPYGVAVDEFQHHVYENPGESPAERNSAWRAIEQKYLPYIDYDGNAYLESGCYWQVQSHIYQSPFYYIDYCLAQICAFQFWQKSLDNPKQAFSDYIKLCKAGGSRSFLDLVEYAGLQSPFADGSIASVTGVIREWLSKVDEAALESAGV